MIGAMSDWDRFLHHHPRFGDAVVGEPSPWARAPLADLPVLSALLTAATVTPVSVAGRSYELLAWGPSDARRGWLCDPPFEQPGAPAFLARVWTVFGGIVEQFGRHAPISGDLVHVLSAAATQEAVADVLTHYAWAWEDEGLAVPFEEMRPYVTVAIEANFNLTAAHGETGRLVWFAPDHASEGVSVWPGCPEQSLYSFDELPDVGSWVEAIAREWS